MKNNKKLIAIVAAIVLALIGLIVYIMKDSSDNWLISKEQIYKRKKMAS